MGASGSSTEDDTFELPQQQIINVIDGNATSVQGAGTGARSRVGSSKEAVAVKPPFTLSRTAFRFNTNGRLTIEVAASVDGSVEVFAPAIQFEGPSTWPLIGLEQAGSSWQRTVLAGACRIVQFDGRDEVLNVHDRQQEVREGREPGSHRWPIVVIFRPGGLANEEPPNGTMMTCCIVMNGQPNVARQLVAWGGNGTAYVMKELYGIQASPSAGTDTSDGDNQQNCVVCLTTPKDTALMPCGHFCVCYECGASLRLSPARNRCPLCRQEVHDIMKLDIASASPQGNSTEDSQIAASAPPEAMPLGDNSRHVEACVGGHDQQDTQQPHGSATPMQQQQQEQQQQEHKQQEQPSMEDVRAARLRALGVQTSEAQLFSVAPATPASTSPEESLSSASRVPAAAEPSAAPVLPRRCLQRLTQEMRQIEEQKSQHLSEYGVALELLDPEGTDLRAWSLRILASSVDASCQLGQQLRLHGVDAIELDLWIADAFPMEPPRLRVIRPCFGNGSFFVHQHGALCLEVLTKQGWSPALSLLKLGVQVKTMMSQGQGSISSCNVMPGSREQAWSVSRTIESAHPDWQKFSMQ